jgi:hypothetical protein
MSDRAASVRSDGSAGAGFAIHEQLGRRDIEITPDDAGTLAAMKRMLLAYMVAGMNPLNDLHTLDDQTSAAEMRLFLPSGIGGVSGLNLLQACLPVHG